MSSKRFISTVNVVGDDNNSNLFNGLTSKKYIESLGGTYITEIDFSNDIEIVFSCSSIEEAKRILLATGVDDDGTFEECYLPKIVEVR